MDEPWVLPVTALAERIRDGRLSPVTLLDGYLARIAAQDGHLGAFVHLNTHARAAAEHAHREIRDGNWRGPLHGIPVAVNDDYGTADMPTTAGSTVDIDWPDEDAGAIARLRAAGAILIGKTRMHEFAWGSDTPPARNPRDPARVPGGASGGAAAAVAAGLAAAALGTDAGGSIRIPASLCGCVGLKPSFGLIGQSGIVPHAWPLDHAGPLSASVADAALLAGAMAGPDADDPASAGRAPADWTGAMAAGLAGLTVGICRNHFFEGLDAAVGAAAETAIRRLAAAGAQVVEFEIPELAAAPGATWAIELAAAATWHGRRLRDGSLAGCMPDVRGLIEMGRLVTATDYLQAERFRRRLGERFAAVFEEVDVIVSPTMAMTAWPAGAPAADRLAASRRLTHPWALIGLPAITLPCGSDASGLPIGVQIAAAPFGEAALFRAAAGLERLLGGPMARCTPG